MIVADVGGPAHKVSADAGFRVCADTPEHFALGLANAVEKLVAEPGLAEQQGVAARRLVATHHQWPAKVDRMLALYERAIAEPKNR
jgi:glycosyltransferase involved in cell wall biosynthesis